jgi:hypothetical protein
VPYAATLASIRNAFEAAGVLSVPKTLSELMA